jgi:hypothetical protein
MGVTGCHGYLEALSTSAEENLALMNVCRDGVMIMISVILSRI